MLRKTLLLVIALAGPALGEDGSLRQEKKAPPEPMKDPVLAAVLSAVLPGGGQFYNREHSKAVTTIVLSLGGLAVLGSTLDDDGEIPDDKAGLALGGTLVTLGTAIWSIRDAYVSAKRINMTRQSTRRIELVPSLVARAPGARLRVLF